MGRLRWLLAGLLVVPLADALLLVFVAGALGWAATVALVVLTAFLGMLFVRAEGRHTLRTIQEKLARGEEPTDELVDGGLLIAAGAFLLTPGLVTDTLGFLLVVPPSRYVVRTLLKRFVLVPQLDARTGGFASGRVYTFGFPGDDPRANGGFEAGATGRGTVEDLDETDYEFTDSSGDDETDRR